MKRTYRLCAGILLLFTAFLLLASGVREKNAALAERTGEKILRFHVLADSDLAKDQAVKLDVRDLLLQMIQDGFSGTAPDAVSKRAVQTYVLGHKTALEQAANDLLASQGFSYQAAIRLERCTFPARTYGGVTFPAGTYDAVRVLLGKGEGQNFWCVLYPSLCYLDSAHAVMPDASQNVLKTLLPEDDFAALLSSGKRPNVRIRLKLLDFFPGK